MLSFHDPDYIMKAPSKCPFCNDPLMNDFQLSFQKETQTKYCSKRVNHNFRCSSHIDTDEIFIISIIMSHNPFMKAIWNFTDKKLSVLGKRPMNNLAGKTLTDIVATRIDLPYFIPDLSNWNILINKIKTYLVFS